MDFIYALCDPRDNRVRYIGKTNDLRARYNQHLREKANTHRTHWIEHIKKLGMNPILTVIEQIAPDQNWEERERYWIAHYRNMYDDLTNGSDGGDCGPDCSGKHLTKSESGRRNIVAALVERNKSTKMREVSRKNGLSRKGKKHSNETKEKMRLASTGRKPSAKSIEKLIERNKTRKYDSEKMRKNARKLWDDPIKGPEMRMRVSERSKAGHWSKGIRRDPQKSRNAARKLWDDPIKGAEARAKLIERNKKNKWHNKSVNH